MSSGEKAVKDILKNTTLMSRIDYKCKETGNKHIIAVYYNAFEGLKEVYCRGCKNRELLEIKDQSDKK